MNWGSVDAFFAMGGYGLYVWGSYVITLALLAIEIGLARKRRQNALRMLRSEAYSRGTGS